MVILLYFLFFTAIMKKIITDDGSITYFNEKYEEHYHSVSGAEEEAVKKFAEPCSIKERDEVNILDICFGMGYNSAAALDCFKGRKINIIALENDKNIINQIQNIDSNFSSYNIIKEAAKHLNYKDNKIEIKIILGDARETIKQLNQKFDIIFLDPFSPKKCPELWTEEFFKDIKSITKEQAILATYSCASSVRNNLKAEGFIVKDGPIVGRKSPGTIACLEHQDKD